MRKKKYSNNDIYYGEFLKEHKNGIGIFIREKKLIYIGNFKKGNPEKSGIILTKETTKYSDTKKNIFFEKENKKNKNFSLYKKKKNNLIYGIFKIGKIIIKGFLHKNEGIFQNSKIEGKYIKKSENFEKSGFFDKNGLLKGISKIITKKSIFIGNSKNGKFHGIGFLNFFKENFSFLNIFDNGNLSENGIFFFEDKIVICFKNTENIVIGFIYYKNGDMYIGGLQKIQKKVNIKNYEKKTTVKLEKKNEKEIIDKNYEKKSTVKLEQIKNEETINKNFEKQKNEKFSKKKNNQFLNIDFSKSGFGCYFYNDLKYYIGGFENDKKEGIGIEVKFELKKSEKMKKLEKLILEENEVESNIVYDFLKNLDENFKNNLENILRSKNKGFSAFEDKNNLKVSDFYGFWKNGLKNGKGILIENNLKKNGIFENGEFIGQKNSDFFGEFNEKEDFPFKREEFEIYAFSWLKENEEEIRKTKENYFCDFLKIIRKYKIDLNLFKGVEKFIQRIIYEKNDLEKNVKNIRDQILFKNDNFLIKKILYEPLFFLDSKILGKNLESEFSELIEIISDSGIFENFDYKKNFILFLEEQDKIYLDIFFKLKFFFEKLRKDQDYLNNKKENNFGLLKQINFYLKQNFEDKIQIDSKKRISIDMDKEEKLFEEIIKNKEILKKQKEDELLVENYLENLKNLLENNEICNLEEIDENSFNNISLVEDDLGLKISESEESENFNSRETNKNLINTISLDLIEDLINKKLAEKKRLLNLKNNKIHEDNKNDNKETKININTIEKNFKIEKDNKIEKNFEIIKTDNLSDIFQNQNPNSEIEKIIEEENDFQLNIIKEVSDIKNISSVKIISETEEDNQEEIEIIEIVSKQIESENNISEESIIFGKYSSILKDKNEILKEEKKGKENIIKDRDIIKNEEEKNIKKNIKKDLENNKEKKIENEKKKNIQKDEQKEIKKEEEKKVSEKNKEIFSEKEKPETNNIKEEDNQNLEEKEIKKEKIIKEEEDKINNLESMEINFEKKIRNKKVKNPFLSSFEEIINKNKQKKAIIRRSSDMPRAKHLLLSSNLSITKEKGEKIKNLTNFNVLNFQSEKNEHISVKVISEKFIESEIDLENVKDSNDVNLEDQNSLMTKLDEIKRKNTVLIDQFKPNFSEFSDF